MLLTTTLNLINKTVHLCIWLFELLSCGPWPNSWNSKFNIFYPTHCKIFKVTNLSDNTVIIDRVSVAVDSACLKQELKRLVFIEFRQ